jgi:uncharacterized protein YfiM (DUF2279 family)
VGARTGIAVVGAAAGTAVGAGTGTAAVGAAAGTAVGAAAGTAVGLSEELRVEKERQKGE